MHLPGTVRIKNAMGRRSINRTTAHRTAPSRFRNRQRIFQMRFSGSARVNQAPAERAADSSGPAGFRHSPPRSRDRNIPLGSRARGGAALAARPPPGPRVRHRRPSSDHSHTRESAGCASHGMHQQTLIRAREHLSAVTGCVARAAGIEWISPPPVQGRWPLVEHCCGGISRIGMPIVISMTLMICKHVNSAGLVLRPVAIRAGHRGSARAGSPLSRQLDKEPIRAVEHAQPREEL